MGFNVHITKEKSYLDKGKNLTLLESCKHTAKREIYILGILHYIHYTQLVSILNTYILLKYNCIYMSEQEHYTSI